MALSVSPSEAAARTAPPAGRPRIAVADNDAVWLHTVSALCLVPQRPRLRSYAAAATLLDEARSAAAAPWDAALVSVDLPDLSGVAPLRELRWCFPRLPVVAVLGREEPHILLTAICAGADGYVLKDRRPHELIAGFEQLRGGGPALGGLLAQCLLDLIGDLSRNAAAAQTLPPCLGFSVEQYRLLQALAGRDPAATYLQSAGGDRALRGIYSRLQTPLLAAVVPAALRASFARRQGRRRGPR